METLAFILIFSGDMANGAFAGSARFDDYAACEEAAALIYPEGYTSDAEIDDGQNFAICVPAASGK